MEGNKILLLAKVAVKIKEAILNSLSISVGSTIAINDVRDGICKFISLSTVVKKSSIAIPILNPEQPSSVSQLKGILP